MDLQSNLIESKKQRRKGGWQASITSLILHGILLTTIIFIGLHATHRVDAEDKPIRAFVEMGAAPPRRCRPQRRTTMTSNLRTIIRVVLPHPPRTAALRAVSKVVSSAETVRAPTATERRIKKRRQVRRASATT